MKETVNEILQHIEFVISLLSIAVVLYGALRAVVAFVRTETGKFDNEHKIHELMSIRADLGVYLLLGLELLISADIITTILNPALMELAILAGVVLLRTVLSMFLNKELKELKSQR
jgi:uncharacterized membrane protein